MKTRRLRCLGLLLLVFFTFSIFIPSISLATAPIGEWKFDEGSGLLTIDSSGQGKTGRLWGSTIEWVEGIRNKALQFAGSSDYVQVPASLDSLGNWSVTAYIKPTGSSGGYVYSEKYSENNRYLSISITSDKRIKVETWHAFRPGWDSYQTDPGKVTLNEWNHLMVTLENGGVAAKSGTVKCYVNGELAGQGFLGCCWSGPVGALWTVGSSTTLTRLGKNSPELNFDNVYPWSQMTPETKDGQSVVRIPKFYYRRTYIDGKHEFWIADKPLAGFKVHPAFIRGGVEKPYVLVGADKFGAGQTIGACRSTAQGYGAGWGLIDIQTWSAIQMLWLVEYADTDSQKFSDNYRGINGLWTNPGQWIDGFDARDYRVYIAGKDTGLTLPNSGWIKNWHYSPDYDWLFLPSAVGGSESTYIPDRIWMNSGTQVACAGFSYSYTGTYAGLFCWNVYHSSDYAASDLGARALHIP